MLTPHKPLIKLLEGYIADTGRPYNLGYPAYQLGQTTWGKCYPPQLKQEILQSDPARGKGLSALEEIASPLYGKTLQSCELQELKCEYLTLEIPPFPTQGIRVLGCSQTVGARFSMRSALLLSILRDLSTLLRYSISRDEQAHFDRILLEASVQLRSCVSHPKTRHMRHTFRSLLKVLTRMEVMMRQAENSFAPCNKAV